MKNTEKTKEIATVNNVPIVIIDEGEKLVPIKPICEALGISHQAQIEKLKTDEILSSVVMLSITTGSDKKQYEMTTIPHMYVFGWLFTINPKNVKPEAKETVIRYKMECYKALYEHFFEKSQYIEEKQSAIDEQSEIVETLNDSLSKAKSKLSEAKKKYNTIRNYSFDDWKSNDRHLKLEFDFGDNNIEQMN